MNTQEFQCAIKNGYRIHVYGGSDITTDPNGYYKDCIKNKAWAVKQYGKNNIRFDPFCGFIPKINNIIMAVLSARRVER